MASPSRPGTAVTAVRAAHAVRRRRIFVVVLAALVVLGAVAGLSACSQTPTSVPVRTFERAQRMDVACLQIYNPTTGAPQEAIGRPQEECQPVPSNVNGFDFEKQLFALVTQSARGEIAVVDLSAGFLVDQNRATPGINFLPVGALPTDVATTPDGKMAFVGSAEPNKAAIYGIPTRRILGDIEGYPRDPEPITLASWPVCALPQNPGALVVVPRRAGAAPGAPAADAGEAGASDGGAPVKDAPDYELVVVLPGDRRNSAKIVTIDPRPFRRGGLRRGPDGRPNYDSDHLPGEPSTLSEGPILEPGSLAPCPIISAIELAGEAAVPTSFVPGRAWDDGVKYVDGGTDLRCDRPSVPARCGAQPCCADVDSGIGIVRPGDAGATPTGSVGDAAVPIDPDAGPCEANAADAGPVPLDFGPLDPPRLVSVVRDEQTLYVADDEVPFIHVLDLSTPGAPRELPPLLATSQADPSRIVKIKELAISPPTREYKRFLYAVDRTEGSIMVYDVTDPATMQRTPQTRPHPELNPFQPPDRILFSSPVVAVAFARHDVPLSQIEGAPIANTASGVLCNPNPTIDANPRGDLGFYYRANATDPGTAIGPRRLRGIFGFATLANGQVVTINVDDWDSPCRRPFDMSNATSAIAPRQPAPASPADTDPYHAPLVDPLSVTNERFFPVSAPHTLRSEVLVTADNQASGNQLPRLQGAPTITANGLILPQVGPGSENTPAIDVSFGFEEHQAHIDQDWRVTYEGALPGFDGISGQLSTNDNYASVVLSQPQGRFCAKGVEDWAQGGERANAIARALQRKGIAAPAGQDRLMSDYVQLTEDLLDPAQDYWNVAQACWDPSLDTAARRYDACARTFGSGADQSIQRDFPILEAYDDRVVLGRFYSPAPGRREVVYKDPTNAADLKLMDCCFHHQVRFRVRTGQLWSVVGTNVGGGGGVGFFSHLTTDPAGRCVPSCEPRDALLNGRVPTAPSGIDAFSRNTPLAMRNPMFGLGIVGGANGATPVRDTAYTFSTRGAFRALTVAIAGSSTAVNPQSMRYVPTLGQIAVVDGASQGLVLIDLRAVTVARAPYF